MIKIPQIEMLHQGPKVTFKRSSTCYNKKVEFAMLILWLNAENSFAKPISYALKKILIINRSLSNGGMLIIIKKIHFTIVA